MQQHGWTPKNAEHKEATEEYILSNIIYEILEQAK